LLRRGAVGPQGCVGRFADATVPREDRTAERIAFPGFTGSTAKNAMARARKGGRDRPPSPARPATPLRLAEDRRERTRDDGRGAARSLEEEPHARRLQPRPDRSRKIRTTSSA